MLLTVWAPNAGSVEVDLAGRAVAMQATTGGWWEADVPEAVPGSEYGFRLDGGDPLPDPRSRYQPEGVHGLSQVVDHSTFPWTDTAWKGLHLPSAVLYELHVGTFSAEGTFDGAILHLDHLVELGVSAVEILPVAQFSGTHGWGYDGVDLYAVHAAYGGPDGLKRFVDACHDRGLGVVLDVVYNHFGPEGNYLPQYGPYLTDAYSTPWGSAVNYDQAGSDEVRRFAVDNALQWFRDYHVDALRLDAVHAILDRSAVHLLEQMAIEVADLSTALGRPLWLIAESDLNDPRVIDRREVGGYGMDAQWSDDFHHVLHVVLTGERRGYYADFEGFSELPSVYQRAFVHAGTYVPSRDRAHGRAPRPETPGWRFLGYVQNHDQVGNRATGDRHSQSLPPGRLKVGAALYLLSPFLPMVFQGEEWGASTPFQYFTSHADADLGKAVSEGRRSEFASFGWSPDEVPDPQDPATYERSKLDWDEVGASPHAELLEWYRSLISLRRAVPALSSGRLDDVRVTVDEAAGSVVLERGPVTVVANLGRAAVPARPGGAVLLASRPDATAESVPPDSVVVLG